MIKGYKSFQIRQKLEELSILLEGYVEYSTLFKEKLNMIKSKSKLADFLIDMESKEYDDKDLKNNYIDVTEKEDKVTFISQVKFNNAESKDDDIDPYELKGRVEIGVGRCVRALAELGGLKFTDKELEDFVNLYKSKADNTGEEFKLVKGEEIKYWYKEENYYEDWGEGSLSSSCMRDVDEEYFDIYSDSKCCQLLILTRKDKDGEKRIIGRALVWNPSQMLKRGAVKFTEAQYFMDRIYCMRDSDEQKFKNFADENGWLRKVHNNSDNLKGMILTLKGEEVKLKIVCKVKGDCEYYPYMDTLKYLNEDMDEISNIGFHDGHVLEDTEGDRGSCSDCDGSGRGDCGECNGGGDTSCNDCDGNGEVDCEECGGGGEIDCRDCDGRGKTDCSTCDGSAELECQWCDGSGEVERKGKMKECVHCEGKGKKECKDCSGEGSQECEDCDGRGYEECPECEGSCRKECEECGGKGEEECPECEGSGGSRFCDDCTGLINRL